MGKRFVEGGMRSETYNRRTEARLCKTRRREEEERKEESEN